MASNTMNTMDKMKVGADELMTKMTNAFTRTNNNMKSTEIRSVDVSDDNDIKHNYNVGTIGHVENNRHNISQQKYQNQQQQQQMVMGKTYTNGELDKVYLEQRNKEIKELSKEVYVVNGMLKEVTNLINDQTPFVDSIENHISTTYDNVIIANKEVEKAEEKQKSNNNALIFGISTATLTAILTTVLVIVLV